MLLPLCVCLSACNCVCVCPAGDGCPGEQDGEAGGGLEETGVWLPQYPRQTPREWYY